MSPQATDAVCVSRVPMSVLLPVSVICWPASTTLSVPTVDPSRSTTASIEATGGAFSTLAVVAAEPVPPSSSAMFSPTAYESAGVPVGSSSR